MTQGLIPKYLHMLGFLGIREHVNAKENKSV